MQLVSANLPLVKTARIWLLLLLALLLPIRGAMASAMLCQPMGGGTQSEMRLMKHLDAVDEASHDAHHHHAQPHQEAHGHEHGGASAEEKCNLCSAFCSAAPLLSSMPSVLQPQATAAVSFPDIAAPAPSFLSDGQERPPRSI